MHHFQYVDGMLSAEGVDLANLATFVGTPSYVYSTATLVRHYRVFSQAFEGLDTLVCYALKSNSNQAVIKTLAQEGAGADVVSEGELRRALAAGIPASKIVFSGVGKTREEMSFALRSKILCFNVESAAELEILSDVAVNMGLIAPVSFRINPDVDAGTHAKISTGKLENKFGIPYSEVHAIYARAKELAGIKTVGIDMHIGSQITSLEPFDKAFGRLADLLAELRAQGHTIEHVDLGGGLGVPYHHDQEAPPSPDAYAEVVKKHARNLGVKILFEPGRLISANAGILLTRVLYLKESAGKTFVIVDAGMNDLVRPTLYEAHHDIVPVAEAGKDNEPALCDVVGPVCESGDFMAQNRTMPVPKAGDLLAIMSAGAYGAVQASTYNTRPLVAEVLVKDDSYHIIRPRPSYDEMIGLDKMPDWLEHS